jgi:hypothetical protein
MNTREKQQSTAKSKKGFLYLLITRWILALFLSMVLNLGIFVL